MAVQVPTLQVASPRTNPSDSVTKLADWATNPETRAGSVVVVLDPEKVGLNVTVFVRIKIREHTSEWVKRFAAAIRSIAEIAECHRMGGDVDYMLKVIVADIAGYDRVYKQLITKVPGLGEVSALFSMERIKYTTKIEPPA